MDEKQRELYINSLLLFMYKIVNCSGAISHKDKNEFLRAANTLKEFANVVDTKALTRADVNEMTIETLSDIVKKGRL